ncbi:MAG: hypothetical protein LBU45_02230 [Azoarcus sp.]|jgi:hypothetical protein|nr:hypothetical protein [Azoarcus sp.]
MNDHYTIGEHPCGGYCLRLFKGENEVGGVFFPDYFAAVEEGEDWLWSCGAEDARLRSA